MDASVAVKWYIPEPGYQQAVELETAVRAGEVDVLAPDLIVAEVGSAFLRKVAADEISEQDAANRLSLFLASPLRRVSSAPLALDALRICQRAGISFYDALYVSAGQLSGVELVTADMELVRLLRRARLGDFVIPLFDLSL